MKIYINESFEIKAIGSSDDDSLTEIVIDEGSLLSDLSDFMIFNYCCRPLENGYEIYPSMDYNILKLLDNQENKISILQEENEKLKESQIQQDADILVTQEAVDFLMLNNMPMTMNFNNKNLGGNSMAAYIATRIIKKGNISIEAGRDYYVTFLTHQSYIQYKTEVDIILKAEGKEELIVDLTNM